MNKEDKKNSKIDNELKKYKMSSSEFNELSWEKRKLENIIMDEFNVTDIELAQLNYESIIKYEGTNLQEEKALCFNYMMLMEIYFK